VLGRFARAARYARGAYRAFVVAAAARGRRPELQGGGLVRSLGGWQAVQALGRGQEGFRTDERILGTGEFVEGLLHAVQDRPARAAVTAEDLVHRVCRQVGVPVAARAGGSRRAAASRARAGIAYLGIEACGRSGRSLAPWLGVSAQSVYKTSARRREAAAEWDRLLDDGKR
jgi:hypothetical protein